MPHCLPGLASIPLRTSQTAEALLRAGRVLYAAKGRGDCVRSSMKRSTVTLAPDRLWPRCRAMRLFALPLLVLTLLALSGSGKGADTPEGAYSTFHEKVKKGDYKAAYAALSQGTRDALAARTQALKDSTGGAVKPEPQELLFANLVPPGDVTGVTLVHQEGDTATVRVLSSGQAREVKLVREPSGWKDRPIGFSQAMSPCAPPSHGYQVA